VIENDNIKELFSKSLENHTSTVRPEVWNGLQAKMAAAGVSSVAATKGLSVLTKWIIGSAAVTGTAVITTIAVMNSGSEKPAEKLPEQQTERTASVQPTSEKDQQVSGTVSAPEQGSANDADALSRITTVDPFLVISNPGRNGATGDPGISDALPGPAIGKPGGNPVQTQDPLVEPGKVVEIPIEEPQTPVANGSQDVEFRAPEVHMPNVFTPNGDGSNEHYGIDFQNVPTATITFMDQNNKTVYSTTDKEFQWNGTFEGSGDPVPNGTYACIVVYQDMNGKTHKKITLIDIRR
jgi:gliding motility-associated-like protein